MCKFATSLFFVTELFGICVCKLLNIHREKVLLSISASHISIAAKRNLAPFNNCRLHVFLHFKPVTMVNLPLLVYNIAIFFAGSHCFP